jgi:multiple sugar transport system substrate-binding protein
MTRRTTVVIAILAALTVNAAPWTGRSRAAPKAPPDKQHPVTLTIWIMPNGPGDNAKNFLELVAPFTTANPHITIEPVVLPWGVALQKIQNAVHGGPAPDLTQLGTTWVAAMGSTGYLLDLSGKYDETLFPPQVLATTRIDGDPAYQGKRFAMPWIVDTRALYYNKAMCAKAGVDPKKDFATWASFKLALKKLKKLEVDGKPVMPLGIPMSNWDIIHNLSWWIWGAGGGFVDGSVGESAINSPGTIAGLDYYIGLFRDGLVSAEADKVDAMATADMLRKGTIATTIAFPIPSLAEDRFGIAAVPAGPKGSFTFLGGSTIGVFKSCEHAAEAIALLKFLSGEAAQVRYSTLTGLLPAAAAQYDELLLKLDPIRGAFVEQMQHGKAYPSIPQWGDIEIILRDGLNAVWAIGKKPGTYDKSAVKRQLDQMAQKIDEIMQGKSAAKDN